MSLESKKLRGCPECGSTVEKVRSSGRETTYYCPNCEDHVTFEADEEGTVCSWCGNEITDDIVYSCPSCGEESCTDCAGRCGCDLEQNGEV
jgi:predicted RNA-binding Zn-ribbon protein involved in translation (DUF1610 family)